MSRRMAALLALSCAVIVSSNAQAACPVGKKEGDTWCEKGMQYRCDRCGSEYCQIITGNKCLKDSEGGGQTPRTKLGDLLEADVGLDNDPMHSGSKNPVVQNDTLSRNSHAN